MRQRAFRAHLEAFFLFATASCPKMHKSLRDFPRDVRSIPLRCKRNDRSTVKQKQRSDAVHIRFPNIQIHSTVGKHVNTVALPLCGRPHAVPFSKASTKSVFSIGNRTARPMREQHYSSPPPASTETKKIGGEPTVNRMWEEAQSAD